MRHAWATRSTKVRRAVALALLAGVMAAGGAVTVSAQGMGGGMGGGMMGGLGGGGGMMGGSGGYGSGPGMMGGQPFGGYGPGYGANPSTAPAYRDGEYDQLHLTDPQRAKIEAIQEQSARERSALEARVHDQQEQLNAFYASGGTDDAAARRMYQLLSETRRKLFEASLDTRKRIDAVLTREQREQLARTRTGERPSAEYGGSEVGAQ